MMKPTEFSEIFLFDAKKSVSKAYNIDLPTDYYIMEKGMSLWALFSVVQLFLFSSKVFQ